MDLPPRYRPTGEEFTGGGMSDAFVCMDEHLERPVLIKRLQNGVDQSRLLDEIAALTAIRSKHVVEMFDVLRDKKGNIVGLVEDYLAGDDLSAILPIENADDFIKIAYAIACGIADIHEKGRVHRDIKPGNMKFDSEGCLRIFDFGLSRPDDVEARTIGTVGTPGYLAPELCGADDEEITFSQPVDVYAFGATAAKMMLGRLPSAMTKTPPILPCAAADFRAHALGLPPKIANVLNSCLKADATRRPTMSAVRDVLATHLLQDRHRATLVLGSKVHVLDASNRTARIGAGTLGSIDIRYDGFEFLVVAISGNVTLNNSALKLNQALPGSCVITLGDPSLEWHRRHVTVDVSHPEVVL